MLVYYQLEEGGEWCRGTVETIQDRDMVTVHYTDYGHRGQVKVGHLRSMNYQEKMMPVQLREVAFLMPNNNRVLGAIRLDLGKEEMNLRKERRLMRVEKIIPKRNHREMEEIRVSVWKAVDVETERSLSFQLSRIC